MADARYFDVKYVINPHMEGNIGKINTAKAKKQWKALSDIYRSLGYEVHIVEAVPSLPDLVFTANQTFPAQLPSGQWAALTSYMNSTQRQPEVEVIARWYRQRGARVLTMDEEMGPIPFEGMGDAHWFPGRRLIIGGYGFRTARRIYPRIAAALEVPIAVVELINPSFYHLDTCLAPLNEETALFVPSAFTPEGIELLQALFPTLIEVPIREATELLACNGHCPNGRDFIVQTGAHETIRRVQQLGFHVIETQTSEFLKSGGSVFCMKLMLP